MEVRDAIESDAEALADIAGAPTDVMRNVIHDRTVRVAAGDAPTADGTEEDDGSVGGEADGDRVSGFVSFDARDDAVHITQFGGEPAAYEPLLAEPARFARKERMRVEVLVNAGDDARRSALESAGFEYDGSGPTFEGQETVKYGLAP